MVGVLGLGLVAERPSWRRRDVAEGPARRRRGRRDRDGALVLRLAGGGGADTGAQARTDLGDDFAAHDVVAAVVGVRVARRRPDAYAVVDLHRVGAVADVRGPEPARVLLDLRDRDPHGFTATISSVMSNASPGEQASSHSRKVTSPTSTSGS